jgi:hypothetical protein
MTNEQKTYNKAITDCLTHVESDFISLHDVYRSIYGFEKLPTNEDINSTVKLMRVLLEKYDFICYEGPEMNPTKLKLNDLINYIQTMWNKGKYDDICYRFWFDNK